MTLSSLDAVQSPLWLSFVHLSRSSPPTPSFLPTQQHTAACCYHFPSNSLSSCKTRLMSHFFHETFPHPLNPSPELGRWFPRCLCDHLFTCYLWISCLTLELPVLLTLGKQELCLMHVASVPTTISGSQKANNQYELNCIADIYNTI